MTQSPPTGELVARLREYGESGFATEHKTDCIEAAESITTLQAFTGMTMSEAGVLAYAGVGSRKTPLGVCNLMTNVARRLYLRGYTLRSGGAIRADRAFEAGSMARKEIYRPEDATEESMAIAERHHPAWDKCDEIARRLHGRNVFQVLGRDLRSPSQFVACWTADGKDSGGTGLAIRLALTEHIPVFNFHDPDALRRLGVFLKATSYAAA